MLQAEKKQSLKCIFSLLYNISIFTVSLTAQEVEAKAVEPYNYALEILITKSELEEKNGEFGPF